MGPFLQSVILIIQYQQSSYFITKSHIYLLFFQVREKHLNVNSLDSLAKGFESLVIF